MCLFIVAFALMVVLHPSSVVSVDRNKFKKCQDSGFCRRNRAYAKQVEKQSPYCILQDASFNPHGGRYTATVKNQVNDKDFDLEITKIGTVSCSFLPEFFSFSLLLFNFIFLYD